MHFVDKQNSTLAVLPGLLLGDFHGLANFLDPGQHRRNSLEMRVRNLGQQPGQRSLADAGRAPEDHRVQRALLQRLAQRLAVSQHVLLTDILIQIGSTQTCSQGLSYRFAAEQVHVRNRPFYS